MQSQPKLHLSNQADVVLVNDSIAGLFVGSWLSLFGFLILIVLLA